MKGATGELRLALAARIRAAGLRATPSRIHVLWALEQAHTPLSHADVAARLTALGLDRTTVYRNLVDLADAGILRRSDVDHIWRFERVVEGEKQAAQIHPHFVCTDCGQVACLPANAVALRPTRGAPGALKRGNLEIQLRGVCDSCTP